MSTIAPNRPGFDLAAERAVIGACLKNIDAVFDAAELLSPDDFHDPSHGHLFAAMLELVQRGEKAITTITVAACLREHGIGPDTITPEYIQDCKSKGDLAGLVSHAKIVAGYGQKARMWRTAREIEELCLSDDPADEVVPISEAKLFAVAHRRSQTGSMRTVDEMLPDWLDKIEERWRRFEAGKTTIGYSTGLKTVDYRMDGLVRGRLYVLAAPPAAGKTALAELMAESAACDEGDAVLMFSMEMSWLEMMDRFMASRGGIPANAIKNGNLCDEDWGRINKVREQAKNWRLIVETAKSLSLTDIIAKVRRVAAKYGDDFGLVVIDYFQLLNFVAAHAARTNQNEASVMEKVSNGLKDIAGEYNVAVVVLSQLVKAARDYSHEPGSADLYGTGGLQAAADVVMFVYRPDLDANNPNAQDLAYVKIDKNRHGTFPHVIPVTFLKRYAKFQDNPEALAEMRAEQSQPEVEVF